MCQTPIPDTKIRTRIGWKVIAKENGFLYSSIWTHPINSNIICAIDSYTPVSAFLNRKGAEQFKEYLYADRATDIVYCIVRVKMYNSQLSKWFNGESFGISQDQADQCLSADLCEILEIIEER